MSEREAFEAWFNSNYLPHNMEFLHFVNSYTSNKVNAFWEAWQAALASQAQQSPKMQFLDRSKEKIITLLWQGICDGTVEAFDVNGMMVIPSEEGMTYVRKEDAISFFGLVEPSQAQQSQWMPIETAPTGKEFLLAFYYRHRPHDVLRRVVTFIDKDIIALGWSEIPPAPEGTLTTNTEGN